MGFYYTRLVHAMRKISGLDRGVPMGGGYGNGEEFLANTIQMIYRSERTGHP